MISSFFSLFIRFAYVAIDAVCVLLSILAAASLRQTTLPLTIQELLLDARHPFHLVCISWMVTVLFFNAVHHLYQTRREVREHYEIGLVIRSVFFAAITVIAIVYSMKIEGFPRSVFALIAVFTTVLFCLWRVVKRMFINFLAANGYNNFNILIVGAGRTGMMLAQESIRHPGFGFKITGFLDDFKTCTELGENYPVLGRLEDLETVIRRHFVQQVFFTIHPSGPVFQRMLEIAKAQRVAVRVVPLAFDQAAGELLRYNIGFIPVLEYTNLGANRIQFGKRIFDVVVAFFALLALAPLFIVIMAMIVRDSPGPALYFSHRYGRNGRVFRMWKFRSMVADADKKRSGLAAQNEVDGPIFKIRQDPRVTRVGRFLRKYSIDELPQVINVLLGDMSLVGPRPLPLDQVEQEDLRQLKRLEFRPGITGLWQVRGRSDLPFHRLVRWDAWYINNWSFWLDMNILFETIPVVLKGKGAY